MAQSYMNSIYHYSSMVNGNPSWTSTLNGTAIWYAQEFWFIGYSGYIGTNVAAIYSNFGNQCPFDLQSEFWKYYNIGNGFIYAGVNEINVKCLNGDFPKNPLTSLYTIEN